MSEFRAGDERLRKAFQAPGQPAEGECSAQDLDRIWRAVSGELPASERRDLVDRLAVDPACGEAWRIAQELWEASCGTAAPAVVRPRFRAPSWLAAAAVLFLAIGVGFVLWINRPTGDTFRDQSGFAVESLVPAAATMSRDAFRLRWTPGPAGARYQVRVTSDDLRLLATATELTAPEFALEQGQLASVPPGGRVFWQIEVALPSGEIVTSETFVTRVE